LRWGSLVGAALIQSRRVSWPFLALAEVNSIRRTGHYV
jgi:hypothetical protein